jgi:hypothetical protein
MASVSTQFNGIDSIQRLNVSGRTKAIKNHLENLLEGEGNVFVDPL